MPGTRDSSRVSLRHVEIQVECTGAFHTGNPTAWDISLRGDWRVRFPRLLPPTFGLPGGAAFVAGDRLLDAAASGPRWLAEPGVATVVVEVLQEGVAAGRYELGAWVLMPNHVHLLLQTADILPRQIAWIKGRTAGDANRAMKRSGSFWAKDYFDRWIRNRSEWEKVIRYVERNPVKAGLCKSPEDWEWSSAQQKRD